LSLGFGNRLLLKAAAIFSDFSKQIVSRLVAVDPANRLLASAQKLKKQAKVVG
jgi:hypothetical protein